MASNYVYSVEKNSPVRLEIITFEDDNVRKFMDCLKTEIEQWTQLPRPVQPIWFPNLVTRNLEQLESKVGVSQPIFSVIITSLRLGVVNIGKEKIPKERKINLGIIHRMNMLRRSFKGPWHSLQTRTWVVKFDKSFSLRSLWGQFLLPVFGYCMKNEGNRGSFLWQFNTKGQQKILSTGFYCS